MYAIIFYLIINLYFLHGGSFHLILFFYFSLHILLVDELLVPERVCWAKSCRTISATVAGCHVGPCVPSAPSGARQTRVAWGHMQGGRWHLSQSHDQAQRWVQSLLWNIITLKTSHYHWHCCLDNVKVVIQNHIGPVHLS